jgi:hypothetical protein
VNVVSVNNVVYLTGKAPTLLGKLSAGAQAAQIEGVRYVVNRIEVPGIRITDRLQGQLSPESPDGGVPPAEPDALHVDYEFEPEMDAPHEVVHILEFPAQESRQAVP